MNENKNDNKRKNLITALAIIASLVIALLIYFAGVSCRGKLPDDAVDIAGVISFLILVVCTVGSFLLSWKYRKKMQSMTAEQQNEMLMKKQQKGKDDVDGYAEGLRRIAVLSFLYFIFLLIADAVFAFCMGAAAEGSAGMVILAFYTLFGFFFRSFSAIRKKPDWSEFSKESDYPEIYRITRSAMEDAGVTGDFRILLTDGCNCGIAQNTRVHYSLLLGVEYLGIIDENELYAVMLHEFAHVNSKYTPKHVPAFFIDFMTVTPDDTLGIFSSAAISYPADRFLLELFLFETVANRFIEERADTIVREKNASEGHCSSLVKANMYDLYANEPLEKGRPLFLESETIPENVCLTNLTFFKAAYAERADLWISLMKKEIQSRSASHPIVRDRVEATGLTLDAVDHSLPDDAGTAFRAECEKALNETDKKLIAGYSAEQYAKDRKNAYLDPLATVTEWEKSKDTYPADQINSVITALGNIGRFDEQEALCDSVIASSDSPSVTAHANFCKGMRLLGRYDPAGIAYLWRAVDANGNYVNEGLEAIGKYCCLLGLEKELEDYRARAAGVIDTHNATSLNAGFLTARDVLTAENLPENRLPEIIDFILGVGEGKVSAIYLVRKTITEDFFSSVFVVDFDDGTDEAIEAGVMNKIFNYLDTTPYEWQYSLFRYDDENANILARVRGALVWEKKLPDENNKNGNADE